MVGESELECVFGQRRIGEDGKQVYSIDHLETKDDRRVDLRQILIDKGLAVSALVAAPAIATAPAASASVATSVPAAPPAVVVERIVEGNCGADASKFVVGVTSVSAFFSSVRLNSSIDLLPARFIFCVGESMDEST